MLDFIGPYSLDPCLKWPLLDSLDSVLNFSMKRSIPMCAKVHAIKLNSENSKVKNVCGFSFLCYFTKMQYIKLNFICWNFRLPSHLSHNSLSLLSLSSNEMHHTFIPFVYSAHGSSSHWRGHIYLELISSCQFLFICQMMFHLVAFHSSRWSINIHLLCLWFHWTKLIHPKSQHSLINCGFKQWVQTSDGSIQQGLVNGSSLSVCLTSWESKVLSSNVFFFFGGRIFARLANVFQKLENCDFQGFCRHFSK